MADMAGSRIQGQTAQQAGLMGLQEQQANQNLLAQALMQKAQLQQQNEQFNAQQSNQMTPTFLKGAAGLGAMGGMVGISPEKLAALKGAQAIMG